MKGKQRALRFNELLGSSVKKQRGLTIPFDLDVLATSASHDLRVVERCHQRHPAENVSD